MLELKSRKVEYTRKLDGVKDSFTAYYVEFESVSHDGAKEIKYTYDVKIDNRNWKEMLDHHNNNAKVILKPIERTSEGKTYYVYQPQVEFYIGKEPFHIDFNVADKAVLFLLKVYCL